MTPKQFIKYTQKLDRKDLAICDGTTNEMMGLFDWLYPFFIMTGMGIALVILTYWEEIKQKIRGNDGNRT